MIRTQSSQRGADESVLSASQLKANQTRLRAAKALFVLSVLFIVSQIAIQLMLCLKLGTGVGIGDGSPAEVGRAQNLVPDNIAYYSTVDNAQGLLPEIGLFLLWAGGCSLIVWGYYWLLSRLRAF